MAFNFNRKKSVEVKLLCQMVKHPIKLPLLKASDSSRSREHDRRMKSEICAVKEMSAVKMNQISERTRSKFLLLVFDP
jgi:hypothetical protein